MTLRIGFTVTWPQMVFAVPTHPVTICFLNFSGYCHIGCYKKAEGRWWSSSSKLILHLFFFSEANLLVSCLSPWQGKNKKKPRYEKKTGCECVLPACLQGSDFLYLITDGRGKVEKQTFIAGFSLAWLYFLMRAQTPHSSWPFPAPPPRHLSSLHPPDQELCTHSPRLMSRHRLTISCSAPWPPARGCLSSCQSREYFLWSQLFKQLGISV